MGLDQHVHDGSVFQSGFPVPQTTARQPLSLCGSAQALEALWRDVKLALHTLGQCLFSQKSCWKLFCLLLSYSPEGRTQGLPMLSDSSLDVNPVFTFCYVPQTGLEPAVFLLPLKAGITRPSTRLGSQCCCCFVCLRSYYKAYVALKLMILLPHLLGQLVLQNCMITSSYSCAFK